MNRIQQHLLVAWTLTFLLVPFDVSIFKIKQSWVLDLWSKVFDWFNLPYSDFSSDTPELVGLVIGLFLLMLLATYSLELKNQRLFERLTPITGVVFEWIIIIVFVKYGLDKIMLLQFPSPTVNLLYTPLGEFDKDILFWTAVGRAPLFSYLTGGLELIGAVFMIFPLTKTLGRYLLMGTLCVVLLIDIAFGIHVLLLVGFLLIGLIIRNWTSLNFLFHSLFGFDKSNLKASIQRKTFFNSLAGLSLIFYVILNNQSPHQSAEKWIGAYKSIDGKQELFINEQLVWIERQRNNQSQVFVIEQEQNGTMLLDNQQGQKLVQLEDFGVYVHVKDLQSNKWKAYKKLNRY